MVTNLDIGVVMDGSSCGSGKICVQGICSPLIQISPPVHCPSNNLAYQCSGHGVDFLLYCSLENYPNFLINVLNIGKIRFF